MNKNKNYDINALLDQLEQQIREHLQAHGITHPVMAGIHTSGVWLAQELHRRLQIPEEVGDLNITFYRDDFSRVGLHPQIKPSRLPFNVEDRHLLLVDDIIFTGRTVRAAMNEIFDFGRPASITLIVLVARGHRELPIEPQIAALREEPGPDFSYEVTGPSPMTLSLKQRPH